MLGGHFTRLVSTTLLTDNGSLSVMGSQGNFFSLMKFCIFQLSAVNWYVVLIIQTTKNVGEDSKKQKKINETHHKVFC